MLTVASALLLRQLPKHATWSNRAESLTDY